jgi:hypothetical protein
MIPLNDDELSALFQQARSKPPEPSADLSVRALRRYEESKGRPQDWRLFWLRPVSIPLPLATIAAVLLLLAGVAIGFGYRRPIGTIANRDKNPPMTQERVVYRDCSSVQPESKAPISNLTFKEFRPMRQITPRVVRSIRDDH